MPRSVFFDVDVGESLRIGSDTVIKVVQKSGRRARLEIQTEYRVSHDRRPEPATPARPTGREPPPMKSAPPPMPRRD